MGTTTITLIAALAFFLILILLLVGLLLFAKARLSPSGKVKIPVSYTHLTLPTNREV